MDSHNDNHNENLPWIEKHRPAKIQSVKIDDHIKKQVLHMIMNWKITF